MLKHKFLLGLLVALAPLSDSETSRSQAQDVSKAVGVRSESKSTEARSENLSAAELFKQAHDGRYVWENFPGFTADILVRSDASAHRGTIRVDSECNYILDIDDAAKHAWLHPKLQSIIGHRRPGEEATAEVHFVEDTAKPHASGFAVAKDDGSGTYRLRDGRIREVFRKSEKSWFEITNMAYFIAQDGRYLPAVTSVTYRDPKTGDIESVRANQFEWQQMGDFALPTACLTIDTGKEGFRNVQQIEFSNHKLELPKP